MSEKLNSELNTDEAERQRSKLQTVLEYLPDTEKLLKKYSIGFYHLILTDERVIFIKKFPESFVEIRYKDITGLEHYTDVKWGRLIQSFIILIFGINVYNMFGPDPSNSYYTFVIQKVVIEYLPELTGKVPLVFLIQFFILGLFLIALSYALDFVYSARGFLRISREGHAPLKIHTALTTDVRSLLKDIQSKLGATGGEIRTPPIAQAKIGEPVRVEEKSGGMPLIMTRPSSPPARPVRYVKPPGKPEKAVKAEGPAPDVMSGLKGLAADEIVLVSARSDDSDIISRILDVLVNKDKRGGVYVGMSRPYASMVADLEEAGISTKDILFVDAVSYMTGKLPKKKPANIAFVENPTGLEEVSMYVEKMLDKVPAKKKPFVFLDSITSLLIYNHARAVEEFTHLVLNRMRLHGVGGIVLSTQSEEADELVKTLIPLCDKHIDI